MELTGSVVRGLKKTFLSMVIVIVDLCLVRVLILAWTVAYFHSVFHGSNGISDDLAASNVLFLLCYRKSELSDLLKKTSPTVAYNFFACLL